MSSAVEIVVDLFKAMSMEEQMECLALIAPERGGATPSVPAATKAFGKAFGRKGGGYRPFWTKTVETVDNTSTNAHGAEGKWGFEPTQTRPVLLGLAKPRHLYAVLKPTPGAVARVRDDDGFEVEVADADVVVTSKEWEPIREKLNELLF